MKIAVSGKGGAGKTTLAGTLARVIAAEGTEVIAVDADPASGLASAVGFPAELARQVSPLSQLKSEIQKRTGATPGYGSIFKMNPKVDDLPEKYGVAWDGIRLLRMGSVEKAASGCLCPENIVLRSVLDEVLVYRDTPVIVDMEAGLEHLGRGTAQSVDMLIVVVEPGMRSVDTAGAIKRLATELRIPKVKMVGNKVVSEEDRAFLQTQFPAGDWLGTISFDGRLSEIDRKGLAPYDCDLHPFAEEVEGIRKAIFESFKET